MPELPEVETVRLGLQQRTLRMRIARVEILRNRAIASPPDPALFVLGLVGSGIRAWRRRGKYLLADLEHADGSEAGLWGVHLRMTGQFHWLDAAAQPPESEAAAMRHVRVRIWSEAGDELRFIDTRSFAQMWWVPPGWPVERVISGLAQLGPEPFDAAFSAAYLRQRLKASSRPIKTALLDQSLVAGVGNIYADESLFGAGILPQTPCCALGRDRLQRLRDALVEILATSIGAGGTTFSDFRDLEGVNGNYGGQAWVYRRGGQPCRRCGRLIERQRIAGRSTHWCPSCQR